MNKNSSLINFAALGTIFFTLPVLCMNIQTKKWMVEVDQEQSTLYVNKATAETHYKDFEYTMPFTRMIPVTLSTEKNSTTYSAFLPHSFFLKPPQTLTYEGQDLSYEMEEDVLVHIAEKIEKEHRENVVSKKFQELNDSLKLLKAEIAQHFNQVTSDISESDKLIKNTHASVDKDTTTIIKNQNIIYDRLTKYCFIEKMAHIIAPIAATLTITYTIHKGANLVAVTEILASMFAYCFYHTMRR